LVGGRVAELVTLEVGKKQTHQTLGEKEKDRNGLRLFSQTKVQTEGAPSKGEGGEFTQPQHEKVSNLRGRRKTNKRGKYRLGYDKREKVWVGNQTQFFEASISFANPL